MPTAGWEIVLADPVRDRPRIADLWVAYITEQADAVRRETGVSQDLNGISDRCLSLLPECSAPYGAVFLALAHDEPIGITAMWGLRPGIGEVKRLFVRPDWRQRGVARSLMVETIAHARGQGYRSLWLDAGWWTAPALTLYRNLGFADQAPYPEAGIDESIVGRWRFMALDLIDPGAGHMVGGT